jgi:hypothetical protein
MKKNETKKSHATVPLKAASKPAKALLAHQVDRAVTVPKLEESERGQWVLTLYTRHDMIMFC